MTEPQRGPAQKDLAGLGGGLARSAQGGKEQRGRRSRVATFRVLALTACGLELVLTLDGSCFSIGRHDARFLTAGVGSVNAGHQGSPARTP